MTQLFIGIDLGSSSVKVEVYDINGNLLAMGRESILNQNVEEWLRAIRNAMPSLVKECITCENIYLLQAPLVLY